MSQTLLERVHNPRGRTCGCEPDCWCQRARVGRAVTWWFPDRFFGIRSHGAASAEEEPQRAEGIWTS